MLGRGRREVRAEEGRRRQGKSRGKGRQMEVAFFNTYATLRMKTME